LADLERGASKVADDRETAIGNRWSASSLVLGSQLALALGLAVCIPLMPHFLFSSPMGGISNFGVQARTVAPYTAGMVLSAWLLLKASAQLALTDNDRLAMLCRITSALLLLNLLSTYPYRVAPAWELVHSLCAILLAVAELIGAVTLAGLLLRDRPGYTVMAVAVAAFVVMALTQFGVLHVLFVAEVTTGVAFAILLVRAVRRAGSAQPVGWGGQDGPEP
jgi:hypothetical protein